MSPVSQTVKAMTARCFVYWEYKFFIKQFDQCNAEHISVWPVLQEEYRKQASHVMLLAV